MNAIVPGRPAEEPTATKGEQTRRRIVDVAMELFTEHGYAGTTMRAVAERAGVSLGNAYYYFGSKEHLVQGFYDRLQVEHAAAVEPALAGLTSFADRWSTCERVFLDVARPFHPFAGKFFSLAAEPSSPLSPFSEDSGPARAAATAIVRAVVEGSDAKMDARLRSELPDLLWLAHMGILLHWVHDSSPDQRRTLALVTRTAPLLERLTGLSRLRVLRSTVHEVLDLAKDLRSSD